MTSPAPINVRVFFKCVTHTHIKEALYQLWWVKGISGNNYDWLGEGIYFWEANPLRGLSWAKQTASRPKSKIRVRAVIGAVIDLGACLDLTTKAAVEMVRIAHASLIKKFYAAGEESPSNQDFLRRQLDCAVIDQVHFLNSKIGNPVDTVRGVFTEGNPVYQGAYLFEDTHVQIAVRNPACIKAVFRVPEDHLQSASAA